MRALKLAMEEPRHVVSDQVEAVLGDRSGNDSDVFCSFL